MVKKQSTEPKIIYYKDIYDLLSERFKIVESLRKRKIKQITMGTINLEIYIDEANISLESRRKLADLRYLGLKLIQNMREDKELILKLKTKLKENKSTNDISTYNYISKLINVLEDKYEYIYESYSENYSYEVEKAFNPNHSGPYNNIEEEVRNYIDQEKEATLNLHL